MPSQADFLDELATLAGAAQRSELDLRRDVALEIAQRERERQFAFRRLELARSMVRAARDADSEAVAVAAQIAALRNEFGWYGDSVERQRIVAEWRKVARAVSRSLGIAAGEAATEPEPEAEDESVSVRDALQAFEAWYRGELGSEFLALLDHEIPEMPVVEF